MKRFSKIIVTVLLVVSMISASAMAAEPAKDNPAVATAAVQPRSVLYFSNRTVSSGGTTSFTQSGGSQFVFTGGYTAKLSYDLNRSASVSVYFHNVSTGNDTHLYTGSSTAKTVSYTPTSRVSGYFYIKNNSGSSVTISDISLTY